MKYELASEEPGIDQGMPMANFNDHYHGDAPDMGAFERGEVLPLEVGVSADFNHFIQMYADF